MTKPWEEQWVMIPGSVDVGPPRVEFGPWRILSRGNSIAVVGDGCSNSDAARLMSAAPDMARVLLEVEWRGADEEGSKCPSCHASAYGKPMHDVDGKYLGCETGTHDEDCALLAALKKAGVR